MSETSATPAWRTLAGPGIDLPRLDTDVSADVCIVGLGGSGLRAVLSALDRGLSVAGLDAVGIAAGAAGRNGGFLLAGAAKFHHKVVAAHGRERAVGLYAATLAEMDTMEAETPTCVRREGSLRIAADDAELADCDAQSAAMIADGLLVERYDGPGGRGLVFPLDGVLQPAARCEALAAQAVARGARLFAGSPVAPAASPAETGTVATPLGSVSAGAVLVCVDGMLERLVPQLADEVRSVRLQMLATAPTDEVDITRPVYSRDGFDYWQQPPADWCPTAPARPVLLGGCRDLGGDAEWAEPGGGPSEPVQDALDRLLRQGLGVRAPVTHRWAAAAGYTESGLPVVRQVADRLFAAGGYSGTGNVVGSLAGRALIELACDGRSDLATLLDASVTPSNQAEPA
jgi:glycine/D-amino acid oxidase-like deaminating enzyme